MSGPGDRRPVLDGHSLTLADLARVARDPRLEVELAPAAMERVERGRRQIEQIVERYRRSWEAGAGEGGERPVQDYGVTTGFGEFKDVPIAPAELERLQRNILLSHSAGVGDNSDAADPGNYFPAEVVRAVLAIRLNTFLQGHSGVSRGLVEGVRAMLVRGIVPLVPLRGSVGSSGDLCPLAHLFAVLLGAGRYYVVRQPEELGARVRELRSAAEHLAADLGMEPPVPSFKEGLALSNGATFSAALLALAVHDAEALAGAADAAAALSLEAVCGCARAFDPKVHAARGHRGQADSAANLRALLTGSSLVERAGAVQDVYSLRCAPVVHGASRDALSYARMVVEREVNAATDNPLFFPGPDGEAHSTPPWDAEFSANWRGYDGLARASYSAGNFHGQPVGLAADFLAIALAELADVSERRTQMLLDHWQGRNLPANLIPRAGVNSGWMIAQYCAAGIVSENKVLAHPASVDSIPTSANSEDHNSMATIAARKLRTVLGNVQAVLAIELLVAAQAVEWRVLMEIEPVSREAALEARSLRRATEAPSDPRPDPRREAEATAVRFTLATAGDEGRETVARALGRGSAAAYAAVRAVAATLTADRPLDEDIRRVRRLLEDRSLVASVERGLAAPLRPVLPLISLEV